jgi:hypothetical protein
MEFSSFFISLTIKTVLRPIWVEMNCIPCHKDHLINDQDVKPTYLHHLISLPQEYDRNSVTN